MMRIGVFDSGLGGLTVLKELVKQLPNLSFIYFADTANCPYGPKPTNEIIALSKRITEFLISKKCQAIVVACNTATASAIDYLREHYNIPFVGMEPAIKPAALATSTKSIGVLATKGTFNGRLYRETTSKYAANVNVTYQIGEGLVELVEQGKSTSNQALELLAEYINPMVDNNIDHLVLGCTHYPFFTPLLRKILPEGVKIVNPAPAVAKQTKRILQQRNKEELVCKDTLPSVHFYSSGKISTLKMLVNEIEKDNGTFQNKQFFENISLG